MPTQRTASEPGTDGSGRSYEDVSYWLEDVGPLTSRPGLVGDVRADVAILGAGYTGLWTAYYLLQREPSLKVVLLESEVAGFGASGRNGGWCNSSMMGISVGEMRSRFGPERTTALFRELRSTVDEVGRVCDAEDIDVAWRKAGVLRVAVGAHELPTLESRWATLQGLGLDEDCERLDAAQLLDRVRLTGARGAVFDPHVAFHHPARLVRGLAERVEAAGATIYEGSAVTAYTLGASPTFTTERGTVRAKTLVFAGEAFMTSLPRFRRSMIPVYSLIALTEPLTEAQWDEIGWTQGECLSSHSLTVDYVSRTHDGRVLFGGRGAPYHFGSRVAPAYDRDGETHGALRRRLRQWFPVLRDTAITHEWGGPLGVTRDWMPSLVHDPKQGFATCHGYAGQGVAPSNLAGRTLADLITEQTGSPLLQLPHAQRRARAWEPEPLRWLGIRMVQRGLARIDKKSEATGVPPSGKSISERLSRH